MLAEFAESVLAQDSAIPPHPVFSTRFRKQVSAILPELKGYSEHAAVAERWERLISDAGAFVQETARLGSMAPRDLHRLISRCTALLFAVHTDFPGFMVRLLAQYRQGIRDLKTRTERTVQLGLLIKTLTVNAMAGLAALNGSELADALAEKAAARAGKVLEEGQKVNLDTLDFDESLVSTETLSDCDDQGVVFPCPSCRKPVRFPYEKTGLKGKCGCGAAGFPIPVPSLRRIVQKRRAWLREQGRAPCRRCASETVVSGTFVNAFAIAGFCSRRCFEIDGRGVVIPTEFRARGSEFETSCSCGGMLTFSDSEFRSARSCPKCPLLVVVPDRADMMKGVERVCPACGQLIAFFRQILQVLHPEGPAGVSHPVVRPFLTGPKESGASAGRRSASSGASASPPRRARGAP